VIQGLRHGEYAPWDFQPHVDASMQFVRSRADMYDLQRKARLDAPPGGRPAHDRL
jgi:hypothetical protein